MLTEPEAKAAIAAYGIAVPETIVATTVAEVRAAAARLLENTEAIVVKLLSNADLAQVRRWRRGIEHRERRGGGRRRRVDRRAGARADAAS